MASLTRSSVPHIRWPKRTRPSATKPTELMSQKSALSVVYFRNSTKAAQKRPKFRAICWLPLPRTRPSQESSSLMASLTAGPLSLSLSSAKRSASALRTRLISRSLRGFLSPSCKRLSMAFAGVILVSLICVKTESNLSFPPAPFGQTSSASFRSAPSGFAGSNLAAEGGARTAAQESSLSPRRRGLLSAMWSKSTLISSMGDPRNLTLWDASTNSALGAHNVMGSEVTINSA
mmetsp:Transcript_16763/g.43283  ORF Transcript_16763/g.43283 Transcript_16763/m.43283 type:complete len:233 (-) Transcript_16763:745-1443(-)